MAINTVNNSIGPVKSFERFNARQCNVLLCFEPEGVTAQCLNLPGVISEGDTEQEAVDNIKDAFREAIRYYLDNQLQIPWGAALVETGENCVEKSFIVEV